MKISPIIEEELERQLNEKLSKKINPPRAYSSQDVLFFPRQKIRMTREPKLHTCKQAFFIERKINAFSTRLEQSTKENGEALVSGLRSAIILDSNGKYLKLKGVNTAVDRNAQWCNYGGYYGLCTSMEALKENTYTYLLGERYGFIEAIPKFTELYDVEEKVINELLNLEKGFGKKPNLKGLNTLLIKTHGYPAVSGLEIKSDTRLDETIYHLTKKQLSEKDQVIRDNILNYLCFNAGVSKACLTIAGYAWGEFLENTNCHIGNFVVDSDSQGNLDIKLIDLYSLMEQKEFGQRTNFLRFSNDEVDSFEWDFDENITASFPQQRRYRCFPKKLRRECYQALRTGYYLALQSKDYKVSTKVKNLEDSFLKISPISMEEFKEEIKRLTN